VSFGDYIKRYRLENSHISTVVELQAEEINQYGINVSIQLTGEAICYGVANTVGF